MKTDEYEIISKEEAKENGLKYYFTGKPCKKGGIGRRFVSTGNCLCAACREAGREFSRSYHQENREARLERRRRYYQEHHEAELERNRRYREENREALRESQRQRREQNREAKLGDVVQVPAELVGGDHE